MGVFPRFLHPFVSFFKMELVTKVKKTSHTSSKGLIGTHMPFSETRVKEVGESMQAPFSLFGPHLLATNEPQR